MKKDRLYKFLLPTFPSEEAVKSMKNGSLWTRIFNYAVDKQDLSDHDSRIHWHSSTKQLLTDNLEKEGNIYGSTHSAMEVWQSGLAVALELKKGYFDQLSLPKTGVSYLLTGTSCSPQSGHNDFEHQAGQSSFLPFVKRVETKTLWVCSGSHKFVQF